MKRSFFGYLRAAFSAKPFGMFVAPNWIGLAAFGVLGLTNPGFWLVGAGLELAYLLGLASNGRFQQVIDRRATDGSEAEGKARMEAMVRRLTDTDQARYVAFVSRCRTILDQFAQLDLVLGDQSDHAEILSHVVPGLHLMEHGPRLDQRMGVVSLHQHAHHLQRFEREGLERLAAAIEVGAQRARRGPPLGLHARTAEGIVSLRSRIGDDRDLAQFGQGPHRAAHGLGLLAHPGLEVVLATPGTAGEQYTGADQHGPVHHLFPCFAACAALRCCASSSSSR